ncbi:MAG: MBL fold metallo-hydrolase [Deltaproteobacteria bacterium]|nr:MBL fold metallo-hydrolase [Deltaproteobacteria bacterium]
MDRGEEIITGVYLVGGPDASSSKDCLVYAVDFGSEAVLIDTGAGGSEEAMLINMRGLGLDPRLLKTAVLTHNHIDHIGGAAFFKDRFKCRQIAHELDVPAMESGDPVITAANWYGTPAPRLTIDLKVSGLTNSLNFGGETLELIHTPGHTPGSLAVLLNRAGQLILFGQDIHGPFMPQFKSNLVDYQKSMEYLISLSPDILCEGHYGIFHGRNKVKAFIENQVRANC